MAELQVRTLFEEGWSEIDHRVRYPRQSDDPHLAQFLTIFNRLAGSADEMGTFIKGLSEHVIGLAGQMAQREAELSKKEDELVQTISRLKISQAEKADLEKQIADLLGPTAKTPLTRTHFDNLANLQALTETAVSKGYGTLAASLDRFGFLGRAGTLEAKLTALHMRFCSNCGSLLPLLSSGVCTACRLNLMGK